MPIFAIYFLAQRLYKKGFLEEDKKNLFVTKIFLQNRQRARYLYDRHPFSDNGDYTILKLDICSTKFHAIASLLVKTKDPLK